MIPLHSEEAADIAELIGLIEDWLLHTHREILDDLAEFLPTTTPDIPGLIAELAEASIRLGQHAKVTP